MIKCMLGQQTLTSDDALERISLMSNTPEYKYCHGYAREICQRETRTDYI